jgi:hypothetical protein
LPQTFVDATTLIEASADAAAGDDDPDEVAPGESVPDEQAVSPTATTAATAGRASSLRFTT